MNESPGSPLKHISSIAGLKALCTLMIFWQHGPLPASPVNLGYRACEFFFLAAGFLYLYSHQERSIPCTFAGSAEYVRKKLVSFYPLHLLGFLMGCFLIPRSQWLTAETAVNAAFNLTLTQAWSPAEAVHFGFNGASWFLSALIFCYFCGVPMLRLLKKRARAFSAFVLCAVLRGVLEYAQILCPQYFGFSVHTFPVIRCLEFYCGMCIAAFTLMTWTRIRSPRRTAFLFSLGEILTLGAAVWLIIRNNESWHRFECLMVMCPVLYVFSFDRGILSRMLSAAPLRWLGGISLEFYIFHQPVTLLICPHLTFHYWNWYVESTAYCLAATLLCVLIYRLILKKPMECCFDRLSARLFSRLRSL